MKEMLQQQFTYNREQNDLMIALADELSIVELNADRGYGHGTILKTLFHLLTVEMVWRQLSFGGRLTTPVPKFEELNSVSKLQMFHDRESVKLLEQINRFSGNDILETIFTTDWRGEQHQLTRWQMLTHLLNHSAQHRAEIAVWLTQCGSSPGDIDLIMFYMNRK